LNPADEIRLDGVNGKLAALHWPSESGPNVLCLHGWLDNAASFSPLSQWMPKLNLVSLDFPGHGFSDHRPEGARYYFTEYLFDLDKALDSLGWSSCHLIGHSLGGAVASMYACADTERVRSLVLLDVLGPMTAAADQSAKRLRRSLASVRSGPRRIKSYSSLDEMVKIRMSNSNMSEKAARLICDRSVRQTGESFEWRNDPSLHWVSPNLMTDEQVLNCFGQIEVPLYLITAEPATIYAGYRGAKNRLNVIKELRHETQPGNHHFHMDSSQSIGKNIQSFIVDQEHQSQEAK
jgi:pimeloyl-ACP methyl ester carboxylesterase